jgi:hypothetical protein
MAFANSSVSDIIATNIQSRSGKEHCPHSLGS